MPLQCEKKRTGLFPKRATAPFVRTSFEVRTLNGLKRSTVVVAVAASAGMIAAGSLFTSCVTNTEPQGIKDLREAKADYIESLKNLKDANTALLKAQADFEAADNAYKLKLREIEVAVKQAEANAAIAESKKAEEATIAAAKEAAVEAERTLAEAQARLERTLRDMAVLSKKLTKVEEAAVGNYTEKYNAYLEALAGVREAESSLYYGKVDYDEYVYEQTVNSEKALARIAEYEEFLNNLPDSGTGVEELLSFKKEYFQKEAEIEYAKANLDKDWNLFKATEVEDDIKGFATELADWVANNAAIPAPFIMNFKAQLPDNRQVFTLLSRYINGGHLYGNEAMFRIPLVSENHVPGVNVAEDEDGNFWLTANFYNAPLARRAIWGDNYNGYDETDIRSIANVVEALSRELVVDSTVFGIDTTGISKAVAAAQAEYEEIETALKNGVEAYPAVAALWAKYKAEAESATPERFVLDSLYGEIVKARFNFHNEVYGKFWGMNDSIASARGGRMLNEDGFFYNPERDSLRIVFTKETFTEYRPFLAFNIIGTPYYAKEKTFLFEGRDVDNIDTKVSKQPNDELSIVLRQLAENEKGRFEQQDIYFGQLLIAKLLYKEYVLDCIDQDTQGTQEAIAAIDEICDDIIAEYVNALKRQSDDSQPFYEFVKGLVGEDCLNYIYKGLDSALAKAAQYLPAHVYDVRKGEISYRKFITSKLLKLAQAVAAGELGAREALIALFEDFMCGEFFADNYEIIRSGNSTNILATAFAGVRVAEEVEEQVTDSAAVEEAREAAVEEQGKKKKFDVDSLTRQYVIAYIALQAGDAFSGEQFRQLLSDVVAGLIKSINIDITSLDEQLGELVSGLLGTEVGDDFIEKLLFGTVRAVADIDIFPNRFKASASPSPLVMKMIAIVAPSVVKYLTSNFGGEISELQTKYFSEWAEKWGEYDKASALLEAQAEALKKEKAIFGDYVDALTPLWKMEEKLAQRIAIETENYEIACANLEAVEAGADPNVLKYENLQKALDQANATLKQAELELEFAKAAYEQVLANHGAEDAE